MALATPHLIAALRATADRIAEGATYNWTHQGHCNCGHLVQTLTTLTPAEIHQRGIESHGDWAEKARDYCPGSGLPIDGILDALVTAGLTPDDVAHLERLSDPRVLAFSTLTLATVDFRQRDHVVAYLRAWALQLEATREAQLQPVVA